jgi:hypothetical protein
MHSGQAWDTVAGLAGGRGSNLGSKSVALRPILGFI